MGITVELDVSSYSVHWHTYIAIFMGFPGIEKKPRVRTYLVQLRHVLEQWNDMYRKRNITCVLTPRTTPYVHQPPVDMFISRVHRSERGHTNIAKSPRGVLCFWVIVWLEPRVAVTRPWLPISHK